MLREKINNYIGQLENDISYHKDRITINEVDEIIRDSDMQLLQDIKEDLEDIIDSEELKGV